MSSDAVGFVFALLVLAWWALPLCRQRLETRRKLREECHRLGHQWGEPFSAMGSKMRNCRRCKHQQHWRAESQDWL